MQTFRIFLKTRVTTVPADEHIGVNENVVGIDCFGWFRHRSECKVGKLLFFLIGKQVKVPRHPHT